MHRWFGRAALLWLIATQPVAAEEPGKVNLMATTTIVDIVETPEGLREITIPAGSNDGVIPGSRASVFRLRDDGSYERIGGAEIIEVLPDTTRLSVRMDDEQNDKVGITDKIHVAVRIPKPPQDSLLFELAQDGVLFHGQDGEQFYTFRDYVQHPDQVKESKTLKQMVKQAKKGKKIALDAQIGLSPITEGRFKGKNLPQVLGETDEEDVLDFLSFVVSFPSRYYGQDWLFLDVYGSWALKGYNSPVEQRRRALALQGDARTAYLRSIEADLRSDNSVVAWYTVATEYGRQGRYVEAEQLLALMMEACELLQDNKAWDYTWTGVAQVAANQGKYEDAIAAYQKAILAAPDDAYSQAVSYNNIGSNLSSLGRHAEGVEAYTRAIELYQQVMVTNHNPTIALNSWKGLGDENSSLDHYAEAEAAYRKALELAQQKPTLDGLESEATIQQKLGKLFQKQGRYREAVEALEQSLELANRLGWDSTVAEALGDVSGAYWNLGEYSKALTFEERSLAINEAIQNHSEIARNHTDIGSLHWLLGDFDEALKHYELAFQGYRSVKEKDDVVDLLVRTGSLHRARGNFEASLASLTQAKTEAEKFGEPLPLANVYENIATTQQEAGQPEDALRTMAEGESYAIATNSDARKATYYDTWGTVAVYAKQYDLAREKWSSALTIRRTLGDRAGITGSLLSLGNYKLTDGKAEEATAYANEALELARAMPSRPMEAQAHALLGNIAETDGRIGDARQHHEEALAIYLHVGDTNSVANQHAELAQVAELDGNYDLAETEYRTSISLAQSTDNPASESYLTNGLAWLLGIRGRPDEALELGQRAYDLAEQTRNRPAMATAISTIASVYQDLGRLGEAEQAMAKSLAIRREINDRWGLAGSLNNLATLRIDVGDWEGAVPLLEEAIAIGRELTYLDVLTISVGNLSRCKAHLGDHATARTLATEALQLAETKGLPVQIMNQTLYLGIVHREAGEHQLAEETLLRARTLAEKGEHPLALIRSNSHLGMTAWDAGKFTDAISYLEPAATLAKDLRAENQRWEALFYLGRAKRDSGDTPGAIDALQGSVDVLEAMKASFGSDTEQQDQLQRNRSDVYKELVDLLTQAGRETEAFQILGRMKSQELQEITREGGFQSDDPTEQAVVEEGESLLAKERELEHLLRTELAKPKKDQRADQISAWQTSLDEVQLRFQDYTKKLEAEQPELYQRLQIAPPNFFKLQADLKVNEAFIEPIILEDRVVIFVVRGGNAPLLYREAKIPEAEVDTLIRDMRKALETPAVSWGVVRGAKVASTSAIDPKAPAKRLYDVLIGTIRADLVGIDTLIASPSGRLRYIPFAALYSGEKYLIEDYRVSVLTQSGALATHAPIPKNASILAFGNPDGSLPGAEAEVVNLSKVWGKKSTQSYFGADATKAKLRSEVGNNAILHLATHGHLLNENPEGSYLTMADSSLTFREITLLPLGSVDLAVLSACQTAVGDHGEGKEIAGLAYQFEMRGADSVIASLWSVNDGSTGQLMVHLYENLRKPNTSKGDALRDAQLGLLANETTSHPYHWAPFLLIGDWR